MRIAIIGAGNVGAMVAARVIDADLADVILLDIVPGMAKGKAIDVSDSRPITGSSSNIEGSEDFKDMRGSDVVVVTAGLARKPGMSREDLFKKNSGIVKDVSGKIKRYCPASIVIIVTNPLDAMTYLTMKTTGFEPNRVIGMAGVLDSARFMNIAFQKVKGIKQDEVFMMGSHGDTMVAVNRSPQLSDSVFREASEIARHRGAEIVAHLKTGSAYFSPSAAVFYMTKAIIKDEKKTMCASAYLSGQYGQNDIYIGVPVILGVSGVSKVIEKELTEDETKAFRKSAQEIKETISKL